MIVRQSDLKTWAQCALQYKFSRLDGVPGEQSCALTFGTILHDVVLWMELARDLPGAIERFKQFWLNPEALDPSLRIDYFLRGRSWQKYMADGPRILKDWWALIEWESDVVLAREVSFSVPIGDHTLQGTADKVVMRYVPKTDEYVLLVSDYKTNRKIPTYDYLRHDLQFTAYCYATTRPEFWESVENGLHHMERVKDFRRMGEWVQLQGPTRRDAGERTAIDFTRLAYAVNGVADSVAMGIFVPTLSGEACLFCPFRNHCGIPELAQEDSPQARKYAAA